MSTMTWYTIRLDPSLLPSIVRLEDMNVVLRFNRNEYEDMLTVDILDMDDQVVLGGLPLLIGVNALSPGSMRTRGELSGVSLLLFSSEGSTISYDWKDVEAGRVFPVLGVRT